MKFRAGLFVYMLLTAGCETISENAVIGIQPLGNVHKSYIDSIQVSLRRAYGLRVIVLPQQRMPERFKVTMKTPRYRADSIIYHFKHHHPDSVDIILAITEEDISITDRDAWGSVKEPRSKYLDWGVFGYGYQPGPSCVVSTFRLKSNPGKIFNRVQKVALHEIGHNLGLKHCSNDSCVMRDAAETIRTIDAVQPHLCEHCRKKIQ